MFFYGTLCHQPILERVLGTRIDRSRIVKATLHHFARKSVIGDDYPALVASTDGSVVGVYIRGDFSARELQSLDKFEGNVRFRPFVLEDFAQSVSSLDGVGI